MFGFQLEPVLRVGEDFQRAHARAGLAGALVEVLLLHVEQRPAALLGGKQHGQRAILLIGNARNGVHDNPEANAHGVIPLVGNATVAGAERGANKVASGWRPAGLRSRKKPQARHRPPDAWQAANPGRWNAPGECAKKVGKRSMRTHSQHSTDLAIGYPAGRTRPRPPAGKPRFCRRW
ncbi:hypothetical protein D3C76_201510 [compost metagenome]